MAMAAARLLIRTATASRNPVFRLMSARTQATSSTPAPASGSAADMVFTFASPSEVFYNQVKNVRQIDVPTMSGNMGILAHHVPILGVLKPGVVSVFESDGNTKRYFVSSGSIAVHPDSSVQLLAEEATLVENLDAKAAQDALSEAQRRLGSAKDDKQKAEAQIEIECAEAAIKAASGAFQ
jgi:F-type H+-transporting ATPase subunit delta